eukprot:COSAG04_NODE_17_length_40288_cov_9.152728_1_plen_455_part_00
MSSPDSAGSWAPSPSESEESDDEAYETEEVVAVRRLEDTRAAAEEYLSSVGFEAAAASRLALRIERPAAMEEIPGVCSDLIDRHGGGSSPPGGPAPAAAAPSTTALPPGRRPPTAEVLAADVAEQVAAVLAQHASLRPRLNAASTSKALATEMQRSPPFDAALSAAAKALDARYLEHALPPTRDTMASAYEIVVGGRRTAAVDRSTDITAARAEVFFAGVVFSRLQPSDTPPTLLWSGGEARAGGGAGGGEAAAVRGQAGGVRSDDRGEPAALARTSSNSLLDFEADLARALALSREEETGAAAASAFPGQGHRLGGGGGGAGGGAFPPVGVGGGSVFAADPGEEQEVQQALAASLSGEDAELAQAMAMSLGAGGGAAAPTPAPAPAEDDAELARALALSMEGGGAPAPAPAPAPADSAAARELMSLGFGEAAVLQALEAAGGDQEAAANILLG